MITLKDIGVGKSARVLKILGEGALKRRIMDMGITKGTIVTVRKVAPLGDPIQLSVRGMSCLCVRRTPGSLKSIRR